MRKTVEESARSIKGSVIKMLFILSCLILVSSGVIPGTEDRHRVLALFAAVFAFIIIAGCGYITYSKFGFFPYPEWINSILRKSMMWLKRKKQQPNTNNDEMSDCSDVECDD